MTTQITTTQQLDYENKKILDTIRTTVAKAATNDEFLVFLEFCKSTKLNPFKKEIWFVKVGGTPQIMTGINGFYAIANNHPMFDGIETAIVEENGKIIKAIAKVYRKDRSFPLTAEAYNVEYNKNQSVWRSMPRVMLSKCAESMALRKAFPQEMNGLYTTEEMPSDYSGNNEVRQTKTEQINTPLTNTKERHQELKKQAEEQGIYKEIADKALAYYGVFTVADLSAEQLQKLNHKLKIELSPKEEDEETPTDSLTEEQGLVLDQLQKLEGYYNNLSELEQVEYCTKLKNILTNMQLPSVTEMDLIQLNETYKALTNNV